MCNHRNPEHRSAGYPQSSLLLPLAILREVPPPPPSWGHQPPGGRPTARGPASALSILGRRLLPNLGPPVPVRVPVPVHISLRKEQFWFTVATGLWNIQLGSRWVLHHLSQCPASGTDVRRAVTGSIRKPVTTHPVVGEILQP